MTSGKDRRTYMYLYLNVPIILFEQKNPVQNNNI